jgi:AraC-like DNA-binding protein
MDMVKEPMHGTHAFPVALYSYDYHTGTDFYFYPHYHDEFEFFYVDSGDSVLWVNTRPYPMYAGDVLIIPSSAIHSCSPLTADFCGTHAVLCSASFLYSQRDDIITEYMKLLTRPNASALYVSSGSPAAHRASTLFQEIASMYENQPPAYELLVKSQLLELLYLAFTAADHTALQQEVDPAMSMIKRSLDHIQAHLNEAITLTDLAEQCSLSPSQYGRLFKRVMGCTPITYVLEKRISYAMQLLTETDMRISAIAVKSGFNNFSYFNRCFRQYQGFTPSEYRQSITAPK